MEKRGIFEKHKVMTDIIDSIEKQVKDRNEEDEEDTEEAGKAPSFTVLLHGSLKVEGMVALVQLGWSAGLLISFVQSPGCLMVSSL